MGSWLLPHSPSAFNGQSQELRSHCECPTCMAGTNHLTLHLLPPGMLRRLESTAELGHKPSAAVTL